MVNTQHMIKLAVAHLPNAYAPYSKFYVSCCIQGNNGQYYVGVNIENIAYPLGCCAEASAISKMVTDGCKSIETVVIVNSENTLCSPCGGCRQRIYEFATSDTQIYLCDQNRILKQFKIDALLPEAFRF